MQIPHSVMSGRSWLPHLAVALVCEATVCMATELVALAQISEVTKIPTASGAVIASHSHVACDPRGSVIIFIPIAVVVVIALVIVVVALVIVAVVVFLIVTGPSG